ncbi:hypothetical protein [Streptomyces sp. NPDC051561]|uniref:hypothetical protein n=1 Tax=Streptomyces sp. NPDC051561 TaxID=3365658 RepID=UPI003792453D
MNRPDTSEPSTPAVEEQHPVAERQAVKHDQDDDHDMYERLMKQAPTSRDSRGRRPCRHVVGGRGIR